MPGLFWEKASRELILLVRVGTQKDISCPCWTMVPDSLACIRLGIKRQADAGCHFITGQNKFSSLPRLVGRISSNCSVTSLNNCWVLISWVLWTGPPQCETSQRTDLLHSREAEAQVAFRVAVGHSSLSLTYR
jgi:hypothetical protein